jgi:hypothetical protein
MRIYSYEDECLACRSQFDQNGNRIRLEIRSPSPPPFSPATIRDQEEDYIIRSPSPEPTVNQLNTQAEHAIFRILKTDPLVDMVFPGLPYNKKSNFKEAFWRRNILREVALLAEAAFPANFQTTYNDAWKNYKHIQGYCHHDLAYRLDQEHCEECEEYTKMLINRHANDYQLALDNTKATF